MKGILEDRLNPPDNTSDVEAEAEITGVDQFITQGDVTEVVKKHWGG